jgi:glycosyltransferase involved in cell wall biosynthesis
MIWTWYHIFLINPSTIATHISPYALTVLATKFLFFWRKPVIVVNEGHFTSTMVKTMALPWMQSMGVRLLYPLSTAIIAPTKAIVNDLSTTYGIPKRKMIIIPNWSRYANNKISKKTRSIDLIYTGRLEKEKQIFPLLKLFQSIITKKKNVTCLIVGDGSEKAACEEFIKKNKLERNIFIKDPIVDIASLLKQAKIFVLNSTKRTEGFPVSILDALSLGTIVVTRYFEGVEDVINDKNGYIVKTDSEVKKTIMKLLTHPFVSKSKIHQAKLMAKLKYSVDNSKAYIELFNL